jgi:HipA-like protein
MRAQAAPIVRDIAQNLQRLRNSIAHAAPSEPRPAYSLDDGDANACVSVLDVRLYDHPIGTLNHLQGDRTIFAFNEDYVENPDRPTLSLSFKDDLGDLIAKIRPTQRVVPPFFSNLLPEGGLRRYLAERAGVNQQREFFLLWVLGLDLPGALSIHPAIGDALPPGADEDLPENAKPNALRFSLAGVQLKFSAFENAGKGGGLTIPAEGVGGSWIVKLPSQQFTGVPENEFSMMTIAGMIGMDVPIINLIDLGAISGIPEGIGELKGQALAISRFDRTSDGPVHTEDFAQVFGIFPDDKYRRVMAAGLTWPLGEEITDTVLEAALYKASGKKTGHRRSVEPDWAYVHRELKRKHVTLQILWDEYIERQGLMLTELLEEERRQQLRPCPSARCGMERRGRLRDLLAIPAGELLAYGLDHRFNDPDVHIWIACPNAFMAASGKASPSVGWAWMVPAISSSRAPISMAREKAAASSETPSPMACMPRTRWLSARATTRTKPSSPKSVMARPLARNGKLPTLTSRPPAAA